MRLLSRKFLTVPDNINKEDFMKKGKKILAAFLAALMVVGIMPFTMFSGLFSSKANAAEDNVITFDASVELANLDKSATIAEGTKYADGFFTTVGSTKRANMDVYAIDIGKKAENGISFVVPEGYAASVTITARGAGSGKPGGVTLNSVSKAFDASTPEEQSWKDLSAGSYTITADATNGGTRITKIVVKLTKVVVLEDKTATFDASVELANLDKSATIAEGTKYADGFFTTVGSTKRANMDVYAIDIGKKAENGISFVVPEGYAASVTITARGAGSGKPGGVTLNSVSKAFDASTPEEQSWKDLSAGSYTITADATNGGTRITKIVVKMTAAGSTTVRKDWAEVSNPAITNIKQENGKVIVEFNAVVGDDGADKVTVTMTDVAGNQTIKSSAKEGVSASVEFSPSASGKYTFAISASRENETDKAGNTAEFDFELPLSAPSINSATSMGDGKVSIVWQSVKEATSYNVYVDGKNVGSTKDTSYEVSGLTVGTKYEFAVEAVRETPAATSEQSKISATATADAKQVWGYIVYGNGANESNSAYEGSVNETGSVTLTSGKLTDGKFTGSGNNGKLVPASFDGLNFYYTSVPTSLNFTLRAKVTVDQWWLSNGQEGFGLMAADKLGGSGWNNSYMAVVSKSEYYWNEEEGKVTNDTTALKVSQKIGIASQEKKGLNKDNIGAIENNDTETTKQFISTMYPLEQRYAANVNLIGNATKDVADTIENPITEMYLTIQKNNTGYFVTYESVDGSYSTTKKYYDTDILSQLDSDNVYVGFFTSRYAQATFSDVTFSTINPADDAPAEEKPIEELVTNAAFNSKTATGTSEYEFRFTANCDGVLSIKDADGNDVATDVAVAANTVVKPATITLTPGKNKFTYVFTPNADYIPEKDMVMSSYEPIEGTFTVTYRTYGVENQSLYVAPDKYGVGTKEDPMSIYDAVKYVQPGQTIVVMEGTYYLDKTVKVERGVDGTAEKPIQMVADPEASSRPVFDFQGICAGMVLAGNYWYFQGFNVTNSANAQKGIQLSGKYCTIDNVLAYHNGNTGIQISRYLTTDEYDMWPAYNLVLNCTSYGNADAGYEDADGFAAKLTVGDGNVFDGCIAYNNADDGWDLFAKVQTGSIGSVTIKNSVAYANGYLEDGTNAGNGNGFKLGGDSMSGKHVLENCVAFDNKAKGIDSNSCPDIIVKSCTTFNNGSYNIALYTNTAKNTDFAANGVLSYRTQNLAQDEQFKLLGKQDATKVDNDTNYFWNYEGKAAKNSATTVKSDWFVSTDTGMDYSSHVYSATKVTRNADNTINMNDLLVVTDKVPANVGARMTGTASGKINVPEGIKGHKTISVTGNNVVKGNTTDIAVVKGTETEIVWKIDADVSTFDYIMVDDVVLDKSKYTVTSGSTVVTFKASYIKGLGAGEHTFRAYFTDGYIAETKLEVLPKTGDFGSNMLPLYAGLMLVALLAAAFILIAEKKRKRA